jgi:hypothetical protein
VESLDPDDDEHWTGGGYPRVDVVSELYKGNVTRADLDYIGLKRPKKRE